MKAGGFGFSRFLASGAGWCFFTLMFFAWYFAGAIYLRSSPPSVPPKGTVMELKRPYGKLTRDGLEFFARAPSLDRFSDDLNGEHSDFTLYEDETPLGPGHIMHPEITALGYGRFSHWTKLGFVFSSSDGTDPNVTGRRYYVVLEAPK